MQLVLRVQVEVTKVIGVPTDENGDYDVPSVKKVVTDVQKVFEGSEWTAFVDPDFDVEEMPQQPGRPR